MIRKADIILGIILFLLGGAASIAALLSGSTGAEAVITVEGVVYGIYELDVDLSVDIDVGGKHNQLTIKDGKALMTEADCPDKHCMDQYKGQGGIDSTNQTIVCLPNKVIVTISGNDSRKGDDIDAIVS